MGGDVYDLLTAQAQRRHPEARGCCFVLCQVMHSSQPYARVFFWCHPGTQPQ
jgi:hypothetical protein